MDNNEIIKNKLRTHGIPQWKLADAIGVSENTLCKHLRKPVDSEQFDKCMEAIDKLLEQRKDE